MDDSIGVLARSPEVAIRPLTVDEYYRMAELGILRRDERIELIEGQIVKMSPIGPLHVGVVGAIHELLVRMLAGQVTVLSQSPLRLEDATCPEPDVMILMRREDFYRTALAHPADVILVVEVADSSIGYDRKSKVPLYARNAIRELWIVDLNARLIEVYRSPAEGAYRSVIRVGCDGSLDVEALPDVAVQAADIFG